MKKMIHVIATVELAAGRRDDFIAAFHKIVPLVREEDGCLEYGPTVDLETNISAQDDPRKNIAVIIEKWESIEALEAHLISPHMLEYRPKVKDMVLNMSLQILQPA